MSWSSPRAALAGLATLVVGATLIAGVLTLDAPAVERARRLDAQRLRDLQALSSAVDVYWTRRDSLPLTLETLTDEPGLRPRRRDRVSGAPYSYRALADSTYELCATFERAWPESARAAAPDFWSHGSGTHCFQLTATATETGRRPGRGLPAPAPAVPKRPGAP